MMNSSRFRPATLLLATIACADSGERLSPANDSSPVVRDSAGIRIVESSGPAWNGDAWTVADSPSVVIGRREGDERYLLGWVNPRSGAVALRDGRIAVLDGRSALIRVYSADGEHIENWGRRGEGPGEFNSYPAHVFPYRGDSILVSEDRSLRFSVFDDAGRFGRRATPVMQLTLWYDPRDIVDRNILRPALSCCEFLGPLPTGALLLSTPEMVPNSGSGMKRSSVLVAVVPDTAGVADSVGAFEGGRYLPGEGPRGGPVSFHFQPSFNVALGPEGYFATEGDSHSIGAYDEGGRLRRIIRLAREPRPITDEVRAAYEDEVRERIRGYGDRPDGSADELIERELAVPYPPHLPAFESLHVDPEGNIWAGQRRYGADDEADEFFVFAADGQHLGIVEVPANLSVLQIGSDFILAHSRDELGVHYVHVYRIEK